LSVDHANNASVFESLRVAIELIAIGRRHAKGLRLQKALGRRDKQGLLALSAEDIEWIVPGEDWPLAGTHRGHAGLENLLQKANETVETSYPEPPEFIAQGDRVLVVGFATGRIKATNRTFEDHWVFDITVRNGKLTNIREYIDTQALAQASEMDTSPRL
jgi:hypothetical protein